MGKNVGDVWAFRNVRHNHEEDTIHPSQFPEDLVERIVLVTTEPTDVVLDPFMGTGPRRLLQKGLTVIFVVLKLTRNMLKLPIRDCPDCQMKTIISPI